MIFAPMFKRLQEKWKVNTVQLVLVLITFSIGGSLCGFLGRKVMDLFTIESTLLYGTLYFIIVTLLWPPCVLLVSIPFGQWRFFRNYLRKMGTKFGIIRSAAEIQHTKINLAIFASGGGSNAQKILEYFKNHNSIQVSLLVSNKQGAGALHHAVNYGVPTMLLDKNRFFDGDAHIEELENHAVDYIILAGFLWKVPVKLIQAFENRIINIHPALLPEYGGKGMYGHHVHEAVLKNNETRSGLTIHLVDEKYDNGTQLFQTTVPVLPGDDAHTLAARILELEHKHFAPVIEDFVLSSAEK